MSELVEKLSDKASKKDIIEAINDLRLKLAQIDNEVSMIVEVVFEPPSELDS